MSTGWVEVLLFADDLVVLAGSEGALQNNLQVLNDELEVWGMRANWMKTRVM